MITCHSALHSIGIIESNSDNEISEVQINTTDGTNIQTYHFDDVEESLESLMSL